MDARKHAKGLAQIIITGTVVIIFAVGTIVGYANHSAGWGFVAAFITSGATVLLGIGLIAAGGGIGRLFGRVDKNR